LYPSDDDRIFIFCKARHGSRFSNMRRLSDNAAKTEKNKSAKVGTGVAYLSLPLLTGRHKTTPTQ
jgi:hypothetical protein